MTFLIFSFGLCVGSFLNLLADRLPKGKDIFILRSHCEYCKKKLRWFELIPVVSFLLQRGRCLRCHKKLSFVYPLAEIATGVGFVFLYPNILPMIIFSCLVVIFFADLRFQIIPDSMIVIAILASLPGHLIPALVSFLFFYVLWWGTKKRGIGFGDVKFAFFMGFFLGYPNIIVAMYIAFLTGALVGVILMIQGSVGMKSKIAFGPFLVAGTILAPICSKGVFHWLNFL